MPFARGGSLRHPRVVTAVFLYAALLFAGPFLHHDLACHQKSRVHCTVCISSHSSLGTERGTPLDGRDLPDAGEPDTGQPGRVSALLIDGSTGRSPPA
jgi:hypothetical protein